MLRALARWAAEELAMSLAQSGAPLGDAHRPWPRPRAPWLHAQSWTDVVFLHWRVEPAAAAAAMPAGLEPETRDGEAWVSLVAFAVRAARPRLGPPLPGLSDFLEVNLRTYATLDGKPGIVFMTLDATSRAVVEFGRRVYRLPYRRAQMSLATSNGERRLRSERADRTARPAQVELCYRPAGTAAPPTPGSLDHWLTERYCLYTRDERGVRRAQIHHRPWPLQQAEVQIGHNTMPASHGVEPADPPALVHFARRQDVVFWALERP